MNGFQTLRRTCLMSASIIATIASVIQAAEAQTDALDTENIVVTGTQLTSGTTVTPVTTMSIEELNITGNINLADTLNTIPQLQGSSSPTKDDSGFHGANVLNLRSMGPTRTLVLLDGQRFVPSGLTYNGEPSNVVNIDTLPQGLVKRVDIVTGGASASYGSDAVAGVVNFVLDNQFTGIKIDGLMGETQYGDNQKYKIDVTAGASFDDGKGHIVIDAEVAHTTGTPTSQRGNVGSRPWNGTQAALVGTGGNPAFAVLPNSRVAIAPPGGVVLGGPFNGTGFNPDSSTYAYNFGANFSGLFATGGDGWNESPGIKLSSPSVTTNFYARVSHEITSNIEVYATVTFAEDNTHGGLGTDFSAAYGGGYQIPVDNAYLPANLRSAMIAQGVKSLTIGELNEQLVPTINSNLLRGVLGADGKFTLGNSWDWKAYFEVGQVNSTLAVANDPNLPHQVLALDAVVSPVTGQIVCRSTLTYSNNGCVPWNVLGERALTPAQQAYVYGTEHTANESREEAFEFEISGAPITEWAGDVNVAFGVGYRLESLNAGTDSVAQETNPYSGMVGGWGFDNEQPVYGSFHLWEGNAEVSAPLVKDASFTKSLDINMAARYSAYSSSGDITTWKVGVNWVPIDDVRIMASQSRDVRAPNNQELFTPPSTGFNSVTDSVTGKTVNYTPVIEGNPHLGPEKAITDTLGITYSPIWLPGLLAKAEEFNIKVGSAIGSPSGQQVVNNCAAGSQLYCALIMRNSSGVITSIIQNTQNFGGAETSGTDFELAYTSPVDMWGLGGNASFRLLGTHYDRLIQIFQSGATQQSAGVVGNNQPALPHLTMHADASYNVDNWGLDVQEEYVGGGYLNRAQSVIAALGNAGDRNGAQWLTNLTVQYNFANLQLYGSVTDLFNTNPPIQPASGYATINTNPIYYYTLGRAFVVGARFHE